MCDSAEILKKASLISGELLPSKSKYRYEAAFEQFMRWRTAINVETFSENVFLVYFEELSKKYKASTLWSTFSMLKTILNIKENINLGKYMKLQAFLKRKSENYVPKKSAILTEDDFSQFLETAPDETFLLYKNMLAADNLTELAATACTEVCDKWTCWPSTLAGRNATMPCPKIRGIVENGLAYKYCTFSATWEVKYDSFGNPTNYTHYETCIMPQIQQLSDMCNEFGPYECARIGRVTRLIEMVGLSLSSLSLMLSLYIFFSYRILKNNRTKIHKNLFFATLFQVLFRLVKYVDQELEDNKKFLLDDYHLYEVCTVLMEYAKTAMFTWMFIEGLYLHNVITVTVFQEYLHINFYIWCGWVVPAVLTVIWLAVMIGMKVRTTWAYYYFLPYYWILEGPRSVLIMINLLFLLNIIRVLVVKLRQTRSSEIEQVRKAVRAAIFLLPLMGIAHILFLLDYRFNDAWKFGLWSYTTYFLNTFQGFFVAVLYCFLNGEVQAAVRNSYFLHASLRRNNYTPCRGFTTSSTMGADGEIINSIERPTWLKCCTQPPQSPEEKEIDLCDINDRRDGATTITMVEAVPMIKRHSISNGIETKQIKDSNNTTAVDA